MRDRDHGAPDLEHLGRSAQVGDSIRETPHPVGAIRVTHADLIDGDDAPIRRSVIEQSAPQVGPRGVAVHREQRYSRLALRRALEYMHGDTIDIDGA